MGAASAAVPAAAQDANAPVARADSVELASLAAGQAAGLMCSAYYLAGRKPDSIRRDELDEFALTPVVLYPRDTYLEPATRSAVSVSHYGDERRAALRDGLGCVLMPPGSKAADIADLPEAPLPPPPGDPARLPWPDGDLVAEAPLPPEVDRAKLDAAVEAAFTGEKYRPSHTVGVVVVYQGRIIAERYAPGWGIHTQNRSFSTAKSVTSALIGTLVRQGLLDVDAPPPIPEWQRPGDPRRAIRLRDLLHMSSGLVSDGGGEWFLSNTNRAYWGGIDTRASITSTALEVEPGTRWRYANFDTMLLMRAAREVLGDAAYWTFPRRELFHRIGMRDTYFEGDPFGNFIGSSQLQTTARDLARFGLLFLNDGVWNGERILPEGWVAFSTTPCDACGDPFDGGTGYGAQWWLYGADPRVPDDTYSTGGARGQYATVVPSKQLVVVRRGLDKWSANEWDQVEFVGDVVAAIGEKR